MITDWRPALLKLSLDNQLFVPQKLLEILNVSLLHRLHHCVLHFFLGFLFCLVLFSAFAFIVLCVNFSNVYINIVLYYIFICLSSITL